VNKKKNTQCRISLSGKKIAKVSNIFLSIPGLNQVEKAKEISSICDKDNVHGQNLCFLPLS
jgi:hypothetical protein